MKKKIAIAVAAVAVVLVGFLFWQTQKTDNAQTQVSDRKPNSSKNTDGTADNSASTRISPNGKLTVGGSEVSHINTKIKYISIKEWGVRFRVSNSLASQKIDYRLNDSSIKNSLLLLNESFSESDCITSGLIRTESPNYQPDDNDGKNTGTFAVINGKYYERIDGKVLCSSDDGLNILAVEIQNELYKSMESLEEY